MKREQLLVTGLGQCGSQLADMLKYVNKRFSTFYVNSSMGDFKGLNYANQDNNVFVFSGSDGAGRNRNKAKGFIDEDKMRLASYMKKYSQFKYMLIFFGMGGGTGSGIVCEFINVVKTIFSNMIINIVGVLPSLKENKLELKNTLECCYEISNISHLINDIKFVNNDKGKDFEDVNKKVVKDIDLAYGMIGHSDIGSIDEDNLTNVTTCKGYSVILKLDKECDSLQNAILNARRNSVFEMPNDIEGTYGAINTSIRYDKDIITECIPVEETLYITYGNKDVLCIGGCDFPEFAIDSIEAELKEKELRRNNKNKNFNFKPKYATKIIEEKEIDNNIVNKEESFINDDDIDNLFDINNFIV